MNLKCFYFIFFIFFSVIMVQKQNEQFLNEELIYRAFIQYGLQEKYSVLLFVPFNRQFP